MKGKTSLLITIILAIIAAIAKFQCTGDNEGDVSKLIAAALPSSVQHDTIFVFVPKEVIKYRTEIVYKDQYWSDTVLLLQAITDPELLSQIEGLRDSLGNAVELLNPQVFEDSVIQDWGKAKMRLLINDGKPFSWSIDADPNPCPDYVSLDSLNEVWSKPFRARAKPWHVGAGLSWNIPRNQPMIGFVAGKGRWQATLNINNRPKVESVGVNYIISF